MNVPCKGWRQRWAASLNTDRSDLTKGYCSKLTLTAGLISALALMLVDMAVVAACSFHTDAQAALLAACLTAVWVVLVVVPVGQKKGPAHAVSPRLPDRMGEAAAHWLDPTAAQKARRQAVELDGALPPAAPPVRRSRF